MSAGTTETPETENVPDPGNTAEVGFAKPKKKTCRRGKKRKYKSPSTVTGESPKVDNSDLYWHSETAECKRRAKDVLIRPVDAPKAPKNSTQFIMDDHDECHLYVSFETPDPYHTSTNTSEQPACSCNSCVDVEDAAFQDIDYVYHSMQDRDNSAYYLQDFEVSYSNMRYEELLRLQKPDLISALENMELRIKEIENKLYEQDPSSALEQLQHKLLQLQEENSVLHSLNDHYKSHLQDVVPRDSDTHDVSQPEEDDHSLTDDSQSCDGCEECCGENDSCHDNSHLITNHSQDGPVHFNKDFLHLAIEESTDNSCDEGNRDPESKDLHGSPQQKMVSDVEDADDADTTTHHASDLEGDDDDDEVTETSEDATCSSTCEDADKMEADDIEQDRDGTLLNGN